MTEKTLNNNQVVVAGEIASEFVFSHEIFGEGFYMVDLIVSRLSDAYDTIPLMVSDRLFDVNESHIGERIMAKGRYNCGCPLRPAPPPSRLLPATASRAPAPAPQSTGTFPAAAHPVPKCAA